MHESSHKLAAIMFTDIVGYTAIMGSDEDRAFEILRKNQQIHNTVIKQFNGTLIKEIGDGMLISFPLATDAVKCALAIQKACNKQDIPLKIGIHEGEMVFAGEDVYGDGVNIASRLQGVVNEGSIAISEKVYSDIKNKPGINTKLIGVKKLKNVDDPVRVYEVLSEKPTKKDEQGVPFSENLKPQKRYIIFSGIMIVIVAAFLSWYYLAERTALELEKSIAVLPFGNASSDEENQYFVEGMMEDIRNNLSKIADLRVISKTSTEKYRQTTLLSSEIANELNVVYLLEGTVQKQGNQIKIHAQLIMAETNDHIWSETYERDISEVFKVQSETAQTIAAELMVAISPEEKERIELVPTTNVEAYDYFLRASYLVEKIVSTAPDAPHNYKNDARRMILKAIELDPQFIKALLLLGDLSLIDDLDSAVLLGQKVLELDSSEVGGYLLLGKAYKFKQEAAASLSWYLKANQLKPIPHLNLWIGEAYDSEGNVDAAIRYYKLGIRAEPHVSAYYHRLAWIFIRFGLNDLAETCISTFASLEMNSINTSQEHISGSDQLTKEDKIVKLNTQLWFLYSNSGQFSKANDLMESIMDKDPKTANYHLGIISLYERDWAKALEYYAKSDYRGMDWGLLLWRTGQIDSAKYYLHDAIAIRETDGIGGIDHYDLARIYAVLGNRQKALYHIKINGGAFDIGDAYYEEFREDPEFIKLFNAATARKEETRIEILKVISEFQ